MPSRPPEHHLPIPLFPLCRQSTSTISDRLRGPCDALIYFLRFLCFLRNGLGVKTSDWWGRWLHQVNAAHAQSKSSTKLLSLCSTQPHIRGSPTNPSLLLGRGSIERATCMPGGPVSHHQSPRAECARPAASCSCARSVRSATRRQLSFPQLALRAYPDDP
jgi:hypothetical protein